MENKLIYEAYVLVTNKGVHALSDVYEGKDLSGSSELRDALRQALIFGATDFAIRKFGVAFDIPGAGAAPAEPVEDLNVEIPREVLTYLQNEKAQRTFDMLEQVRTLLMQALPAGKWETYRGERSCGIRRLED